MVNVLLIKNNAIVENYLFVAADASTEAFKAVALAAENKARELAAKNLSNWDEYTPADIEACVENGVFEFGVGSICISWPECEERGLAP